MTKTITAEISKSSTIKKADLLFALGFIGVLAYMLFLTPYGFASADEAFYLTVPYRLTQGDVFFVDEWHVSQLSGFLLYPLMKIFLYFNPGRDGMVLSFRYIYLVVVSLATLYLYLRLRRTNPLGAVAAALVFMLYSPFCIKALSYNSMSALLLGLMCITTATVEKHCGRDMYFAGLCMAGAVLSGPYLALLPPLYFAGALLANMRAQRHSALLDLQLSKKSAMSFFGGILTLFVLFCVFALGRSTLGELVDAFPYVLKDPEHVDLGWLWYVKNYVYCIITSSPYSLWVLVIYCILTAVMLADKRRIRHRLFYSLAALMLSVWYFAPFTVELGANEAMLPINFLGFYSYCLSEKRDKNLFRYVFIPGLLSSACLHHGSNQRYFAICNAASVCAIASTIFIAELAGEMFAEARTQKTQWKKAAVTVASTLVAAMLPVQLGAEIYAKASDRDIRMLDTTITQGVEKGLITTRENAAKYSAVLEDTQRILEAEGAYVLYVSTDTWLPLADEKHTASSSGWTAYDKPELSVPMLVEYLKLHPEKRPAYIYVAAQLEYSYQEPYDGRLIIDALNLENRPVETTDTGYMVGFK